MLTNSTSPRPPGTDWSERIRPTKLGSWPAATRGVGTSANRTPGAVDRIPVARVTLISSANSAWMLRLCPLNTGTRTHVPATSRSGRCRILRDSWRSFCSSSVSRLPSSTIEPASGITLKAIGAT